MLQQTTVAAVVPYFYRFLDRFPTLANLAAADESDVLRLWEGLGYYSRARNLHRSAKRVVEKHGGELPRDEGAVRDLPGFGRYTANAVLSQAFDLKLPILEANSVRLLCRLFAIADDPKSPATRKLLWQRAEELLPNKRAGDFNQALMELGAVVCSPNQPLCDACPLAPFCQAKAQGRVAEIPIKAARPKIEAVREVAVVMWRDKDVFLVQRPPTGRWASLWEFPRVEVAFPQTVEDAAVASMKSLGFDVDLGSERTTIHHSVTRFRITLICFEATHRAGAFRPDVYPRGEWIVPARLAEYPVSRPQRTLATLVQSERERLLF